MIHDLYLRAHIVNSGDCNEEEEQNAKSSRSPKLWPDYALVWDTETTLGLEQTLKVGAALNFGCAGALVLLVIAIRKQPDASPELGEPNPSSPETAESSGFTFGTWLLLYVLSGFIALSLEILWLRLLTVMLKCTAFTFGTMLTIYLGGLSLGAIAGTKFVQTSRRPVSAESRCGAVTLG